MSLIGAGAVVAAGFAWAAGSVYSNRRPIKTTTSVASGMQMLAGGSLLLLLALIAGDFRRLNLAAASWVSLSAFAYLVLFGSLVAFTAYSWLLRNVTTSRAATYAYVNPVVAVLLGWLLASEPLTLRMLVAAAVIVCSVVLITTYGAEHTQPATDELHDSECPTPPCA
jgi:drug/metabolite transporter (DMT)-like permease